MSKPVIYAMLVGTLVCLLPAMAEAPQYDRSREVTLDGNVLYVGERSLGVFLIMKERDERTGHSNEVLVQLPAKDLLESRGIELAAGEKVGIVGSRVTWSGSEMILARQLTYKGKTVTLRDESGGPVQ